MRLSDQELAEVRILADTLQPCCPEGTEPCPRCRVLRGAYALALEVEALRAGLPQQPIAVLQASRLAEAAVLARELVNTLDGVPLPARAISLASQLESALDDG